MAGDIMLPASGLTLVMISKDSVPRWAGWGMLAYWAYQKYVATQPEPSAVITWDDVVNTPTIDDLIEQAEGNNWHSVLMPESKHPDDMSITLAQLYEARDIIKQQQSTLEFGLSEQNPWAGEGITATSAGNLLIVSTDKGLKVAGSSGINAYGDPPVYADGV